jgi:transposase
MKKITDTSKIIEELKAQVAKLANEVARQALLIKHYEERDRLNRARQFGASSEKTPEGQLSLFNEIEAEADVSAPEPKIEEIAITYKRKKQSGKREKDLAGLPTERIDYEISEEQRSCPQCGETMAEIGVDVRRELKYIPAQVVVVEHARHTYACKVCGKQDCREIHETDDYGGVNSDRFNPGSANPDGEKALEIRVPVIKAKAPAPLIPKSIASASLVSAIAEGKYVNSMPLYRQEKAFERDGISISRQNMANWLIYVCEIYLQAVYKRMIEMLLAETVLHADETTLQVLHEPGREAKQKSYIWQYRTGGCAGRSIVIYDYRETRGYENPEAFLAGFKGFLHCDGLEQYRKLSGVIAEKPTVTIVGCWAHARRKFMDAQKALPKDAQNSADGTLAVTGVRYINKLFELERSFAAMTPEARLEVRIEKSKPVADDFFAWCENANVMPKFYVGQAISYALNQRKYLMNIFLDGRLEISNNLAERGFKTPVSGRKNWLFANTPAGASASVVLYSVLATASENGLHPRRYLEWLLTRLTAAKSSVVGNLLPWCEDGPGECRLTNK